MFLQTNESRPAWRCTCGKFLSPLCFSSLGISKELSEISAFKERDTIRSGTLTSSHTFQDKTKTHSQAYRNKLFKTDLLVFVGVTCHELLHNLPYLVSRNVKAGFSKELLKFKIAYIATVINICNERTAVCNDSRPFLQQTFEIKLQYSIKTINYACRCVRQCSVIKTDFYVVSYCSIGNV